MDTSEQNKDAIMPSGQTLQPAVIRHDASQPTNLSDSFLSLKLPPPPRAVLLVKQQIHDT